MGIDKSLRDGFPTVIINGVRYHYGRETVYGQYLVENAEDAKDAWCFDKRDDLLAFLINLPESADPDWMHRKYPDWSEVTHEQRMAYVEEHRADLRQLAEEKHEAGTAEDFNVLRFDDEGAGYGAAYANPAHFAVCDHVNVSVQEHEHPFTHSNELLIELETERKYDEDPKTITIWRRQALKLAAALIAAAQYVEQRLPEVPTDAREM